MFNILEVFSYSFLTRAFFVGLFVSLTASLLGVSLVLRRLSMVGDGLSHVGFGALGLASLFSISPMYLTLPILIISSFLLLKLSEKNRTGDSAIAIISSSALAIGVIAISYAGVNTDLNAFLFGSILAVSKTDAYTSLVLSFITLTVYVVFYHQIYLTTFDPIFSKAIGIKVERYTILLSLLTAIAVVVGMRILGSLLVSSLIIFPTFTAMKVCKKYFSVTLFATFDALLVYIVGFFLSYCLSLPTGASIVNVHLIVFICVFIFSEVKKWVKKREVS